MVLSRPVRTLLLLVALALGIGSTTAAIACAAMEEPPAMAMMPADHCGTDGGDTPYDTDKAAPCALACPTGCLMAMPVAVGTIAEPLGTSLVAACNSPLPAGVVVGPEPPRPRVQVAT